MASKKLIGQMFSLLTAQWPKEQASGLTLRVYEMVLTDVPDDILQAAVVQLLSQATFRPTAAEVRRAAFEIMRGQETSAIEAWGEVKRMVHKLKTQQEWSCPLILKALDCIGGLSAFAFSQTDDEASWRARFIEAYNVLAERERKDALMLPEVKQLIGVAAATPRVCGGRRELQLLVAREG